MDLLLDHIGVASTIESVQLDHIGVDAEKAEGGSFILAILHDIEIVTEC
jgi:hypothetical protein